VIGLLILPVLAITACAKSQPLVAPIGDTRTAVASAVVATPSALPTIPTLTVSALPLADPTPLEKENLGSRLKSSGFTAGTTDGCDYLVIVGWSTSGMDVFSGHAGSGLTRNCDGDPYSSFQAFRDGHRVADVDALVPGAGAVAAQFTKISNFYDLRPALKIINQGGTWQITRATWGKV
jgi:hypothetical protein